MKWPKSFRPHVWGSFFHRQGSSQGSRGHEVVFVPMFGDPFFTTCTVASVRRLEDEIVFVPMFGDPFSLMEIVKEINDFWARFRPHVWGFFFHMRLLRRNISESLYDFRPHVWGFFFHRKSASAEVAELKKQLFSSPCLGILFSQPRIHHVHGYGRCDVFVPMFWDPFFT